MIVDHRRRFRGCTHRCLGWRLLHLHKLRYVHHEANHLSYCMCVCACLFVCLFVCHSVKYFLLSWFVLSSWHRLAMSSKIIWSFFFLRCSESSELLCWWWDCDHFTFRPVSHFCPHSSLSLSLSLSIYLSIYLYLALFLLPLFRFFFLSNFLHPLDCSAFSTLSPTPSFCRIV